jgi:hypothetical protein
MREPNLSACMQEYSFRAQACSIWLVHGSTIHDHPYITDVPGSNRRAHGAGSSQQHGGMGRVWVTDNSRATVATGGEGTADTERLCALTD